MSNRVWTIESGEYSDYQIHGVYSSRQKAQQVLDFMERGAYSPWIEERTLDPAVHEIRQGMNVYTIRMDSAGNVEEVAKVDDPRPFEVFSYPLHWWHRSKVPAYRDTLDAIVGCVFARDEHHAIKITNEYRVREIAKHK